MVLLPFLNRGISGASSASTTPNDDAPMRWHRGVDATRWARAGSCQNQLMTTDLFVPIVFSSTSTVALQRNS